MTFGEENSKTKIKKAGNKEKGGNVARKNTSKARLKESFNGHPRSLRILWKNSRQGKKGRGSPCNRVRQIKGRVKGVSPHEGCRTLPVEIGKVPFRGAENESKKNLTKG